MSAVAPTVPYDPLGLDAPFAQGNDETDRYEAVPAWHELGESPYAEATETAGAYEDLPRTRVSEEDLAWLDVEAKSDGSETSAEDIAVDGEELDEREYEHAREWQRDATASEAEYFDDEERDASESSNGYTQKDSFEPEGESLAASPSARPALKRATVGGFGRYRSDVASLAPSERAKIVALAKYVLWSFGPGRTAVRSIELVGHADRDVARGSEFEKKMSRNRALQMRAVLADTIDRQSAAHQPAEPPWPPFSARLAWSIVPQGARQLLVANPRTERERARNRRVDIALRAIDVAPVRSLAFEAEDSGASIEWTFPIMLRFSKIVPAGINATNCCRAVQTASRLLEAANPPKSRCGSFNFYGSQLITARDYQAPFSATRKCCQWTDSYWRNCRSEPHQTGCAHCGDVPGPHLVLKYAKQDLQNAVDRIKRALDQGCTVAAGVLSGICDDKPEVGCARVAKADVWRQCPEHWVLIIAYHQDTFLFWDSSQASAMQTRERHHFGLLEYDRDTPRLSTARSVAGADKMVVDASGFHTRGYPSAHSQKRFQVLDLRNLAPCPAWEANKRCGEFTEDGRFAPGSCSSLDTFHENYDAQEAEFFDDEERDASESSSQNAQQEWFEPEDDAGGAARPTAQLPAQQREWVLALHRSALERLPDPAQRTRFLQQDWSDIEFPGNVPRGQSATVEIKRNWALARELFGAMAGVVPERRVPKTIRFRDRPVRPVPGQPRQQLFGEARDAFVRMCEAARQDGVELSILSSWRSRARQAAASANQPNPNAVARKASAHMYGLAIDLRMGVAGLPVKEINTRVDRATAAKAGTAAKMGNLVRMYRSPVYKWMSLRAREFGWYPYRNEPWHWEYNPPGLKARFEGDASHEFEQAAGTDESRDTEAASEEYVYEDALHAEARCHCQHEEAASPSLLRTFTAKALGVKIAILVTQAAQTLRQVEMLVFAHGLDLCRPVRKNRPATFITDPPFHLGNLVEASGRPIVLLVPFLDWEHMDANGMAFGRKWHRLAQPAVFNQVAAEALEQVRTLTGSASAPALQRLILSGHSRAYGFFDALAHASASPQMHSGALGRPLHVWALDTTYSAPIADWNAWLQSRDDLQATVVYRHGTYKPRGSTVPRELTTGIRGKQFGRLAATSQGRLSVLPVAANKVSHCSIPNAYLPRLLAALPALPTTGELEAEADEFGYEDGEDLAGLATEREALSYGSEAIEGEWSEGIANEEEDVATRFDARYESGEDLAGFAAEAEALGSGDEAVSGEWGEGVAGEEEGAPARFDAFGDERDSEWSSESSEELQSRDNVDEEAEQPLSFEYEEQETSLAGSGLTPAEQKAVEITSLFETGKRGGFYGLSGNFDGQGLSFGLVNWTIGTGSLQPLLRDFAREHPAHWAWVFGADASSFLQLIARKGEDARKEQHRFAVEQMNTVSTGSHGKRIWTVRQPWVGYFRRLSEDPAFQQIQVRYVRDLLASAANYCRRFHFSSEQAFCFMFDAVASHGKWWLHKQFDGVKRRRALLEQALSALAARHGAGRVPESEALLAIADVLATTSAQRWADKVRRRKRWFVTGQHPRGRELDGLRPRADVPYSTSTSTTRVHESGEADIASDSELADDAQAILGKWTVRVKDWVWEYEFSPEGKVVWRDTRSNEKGVGRWSLAPKVINISWLNSATKETWLRSSLTSAQQTGWYESSYYTGAYEAKKVIGTADAGVGRSIPPGGLTLPIDTQAVEVDLGWIRMTKRHLFVHGNLHLEPTTSDVETPSGVTLTPLNRLGFPVQSEQRGGFPNVNMRWWNLGPSMHRWRFLRLPPSYRPPNPVRPSVVGTLTFTESDTWPGD
ncbi:D-alanyl-D-alanine carboxypeptidase family protein [Cupriavidus necator]|uniref:D-alanyl-D-alanine carboxypeptidase family protein n=1 Tax=Cupriavidus necator TaxID=106590 RepID=UPI0005B521AD|nr:D-alanyl-D-alanine carboxypeptidase family protein [Cupriavidus necator]